MRWLALLAGFLIAHAAHSAPITFVALSTGVEDAPEEPPPDPPPVGSSWTGIPDPATNHGYDALDVTEPADHANWPGAEATGHYYVCPDGVGGTSTDTSNTYGYPNLPRETIPASVTLATAGGKLVLAGTCAGFTNWNDTDGDEITIAGDGNATNQNWIVGRCSGACTAMTRPALVDPSFTLNGDYTVFQDVDVTGYDVDAHADDGVIEHGGSFQTVKHVDFGGDGADHGTGPRALAPAADTVYYDLTLHDFGDWQGVAENDYHGVKPASSTASTRIWLLEVSGTHISGDTIQIGTANNNLGTGPSFVYIGGGFSTENGENAIDIKTSDDVIISGHVCSEMDMGTGSGGNTCYSVHNAARRTWVLFNTSFGQNDGIAVSFDAGNPTQGFIIGNKLYGHSGRAILIRDATGTAWRVVNNTLYNNANHIEISTNDFAAVRGNLFGARSTPGSDWDIETLNSAGFDASTFDYDCFDDYRVSRGSTNTSFATLNGTYAEELNGIENCTPAFTDAGAADFSLQAGSSAVNAGTEDEAYDTFETLYGIDIRVDFNGDPRPMTAGDWDIGAFERQ
jgi:hypothetical protein